MQSQVSQKIPRLRIILALSWPQLLGIQTPNLYAAGRVQAMPSMQKVCGEEWGMQPHYMQVQILVLLCLRRQVSGMRLPEHRG